MLLCIRSVGLEKVLLAGELGAGCLAVFVSIVGLCTEYLEFLDGSGYIVGELLFMVVRL